MYTGVYLKINADAVSKFGLPPPEHDPGTRFVEKQLAAIPADPDDPDLTYWTKLPSPVMSLPPAGFNISCWRDPFCLRRPAAAGGEGDEWVVCLASGIRGVGGAVLRFKSKHFTHGWEFDGFLADADNTALGIKGQDWECPIFTKLPCSNSPPPISTTAPILTNGINNEVAVVLAEKLTAPCLTKRLRKIDSRLLPDSSTASTCSTLITTAPYPATLAGYASKAILSEVISLVNERSPTPSETRAFVAYVDNRMSETASVSSGPVAASAAHTGSPSDHTSSQAFSKGETTVPSGPAVVADLPSNPVSNVAGAATAAVVTTTLADAAAAALADGMSICAPLTEPVLAAAAVTAATAAAHKIEENQHPAVNLAAWLEQQDTSRLISRDARANSVSSNSITSAVPAATPASPARLGSIAAQRHNHSASLSSISSDALAYYSIIDQSASQLNLASINSARLPSSSSVVSMDEGGGSGTGQIGVAAAPTAKSACAGSLAAVSEGTDAVVMVDSGAKQPKIDRFSGLPALSAADWTVQTAAEGGEANCLTLSSKTYKATSSNTSSSVVSSSGVKRGAWWFCVSPDACNNPITWWLGDFDGRRFDIATADGPHRLDLGTTLYAATLWVDEQGRNILYGWIQEHRRVPTPPSNCQEFTYAGCISTPRVLHLVDGRLYQQPLPEIDRLRTKVSWHAQELVLNPQDPLLPLQVVSGTHLDINFTALPPINSSTCDAANSSLAVLNPTTPRVGLVFKSWRDGGNGAAVLSFDWADHSLVIDFDEPFPDAYNPFPEDTPNRRRIGGKLRNYAPGEPLSLRVLLDGSAVEVFTSTGESLTTRMYRGHPPKCACSSCSSATAAAPAAEGHNSYDDETGIALFAAGAPVMLSALDVWEMGSCRVEGQIRERSIGNDIALVMPTPAHATDAVKVPAVAPVPTGPPVAAVNSGVPMGVTAAAAVPAAGEQVSVVVELPTEAAVATHDAAQQQQEVVAAAYGQHVPAGDQAGVGEDLLHKLSISSKSIYTQVQLRTQQDCLCCEVW
eukprot:GHRR01001115.1.p1 GENE.GHRR01001115.1~~GHRR01001115.1.p1  ORF type:complete len:1028 (+),score=415.34 GHRR01001115.1:835-3918(+)